MLDSVLDFVQWWRPSLYRGVGIRGGLVLGVVWASVSGVAAVAGWSPFPLSLALIGSAAMGYRLERFGGAIAVVIFSLGFWWWAVDSGWPWPFSSGFGFVMGLVYGAATTEKASKPKDADGRRRT